MEKLFSIVLGSALVLATHSVAEATGPNDIRIEDGTIQQSLTGVAGAAENGKLVFAGRKAGNCLACHQNNDMLNESFHGEVGPEMNGVADRWNAAQLRAILVNSKAVFGAQTIMPAFYYDHDKNGFRIAEEFQGQTILSAQDIEDVIAYLMTLKEE